MHEEVTETLSRDVGSIFGGMVMVGILDDFATNFTASKKRYLLQNTQKCTIAWTDVQMGLTS